VLTHAEIGQFNERVVFQTLSIPHILIPRTAALI
jgi:hypothetical protein